MNNEEFLIEQIRKWSALFQLDYPKKNEIVPLPIERVGLEMEAFLAGIKVGNLLVKNQPIVYASPPEIK